MQGSLILLMLSGWLAILALYEIFFMLNYLWAIKLESLGTNKKSLKKKISIFV